MGAAKRLNTVQPAISRSIAELESSFGVRLLHRHPHGTVPTEYGRALVDCGAAAFDDLRRGVRNIEFLADPEAGEIRIGSSPLLASTYVSAVFDRLSRRRPRILSRLVTGYTETLYRELGERKVDLLVGRKFAPLTDERLAYEVLFNDPYVVVVGRENPWARSALSRRVSCRRPRTSSRDYDHALPRSEAHPAGNRPLSHHVAEFRFAISRKAQRVQGVAHCIADR